MNRKRSVGTAFAMSPLILGFVAPAPAYAQTGGSEANTGLEEIVVTARKREENLQETPVSITAFTASSIEKLSVSGLNDVGKFAPNVLGTSGQASGSDANFFIRGIGQADWFGTVDPGVAVYIDGIYQGRSVGGNIDPADIARIEVLKGPQGTLFGRNAIGGAVNIVTAVPTGELGGRIKLGYGQRDHRQMQGMVNVPLIDDQLAARVSFNIRSQDGYVKRVADDKTGFAVDERTARGSLYWTPGDRFTALLVADYRRGRGTAPGIINRTINTSYTTPVGLPIPAGVLLDRSSDPYLSFSGADNSERISTWGVGLTMTYDLSEKVTLKSLTAYRDQTSFISNDQDATRYVLYDFYGDTAQHQFSQEFQLNSKLFDDRLNLTTGLYYFREKTDDTNAVTLGGPTQPGPAPSVLLLQRVLPTNRSQAAFAQGTFQITDQWSVTGGLRYSYEKKTVIYDAKIDNSAGVVPFLPPTIFNFLPAGTTVKKNWKSWTPKLGTEFKVNDDAMLYASWAKGFRSGGFNGKLVPGQTPASYDPEKVDSYEIGWKTEWLNRRLRLNGAVWYTNYRDIQLNVLNQLFIQTQNGGKAELKGFEIEIDTVPIPGLHINGGLGYTDAQYKSLVPGAIAAGILEGYPLPYTPKWTANLGVEYEIETAKAGTFTLRADYSYVSDYLTFPDNPPDGTINGHSLVNTRMSWEDPDKQWQFSFYVKNVFDKFYAVYTQDFSTGGALGVNNFWPGEPRTWGVELVRRF